MRLNDFHYNEILLKFSALDLVRFSELHISIDIHPLWAIFDKYCCPTLLLDSAACCCNEIQGVKFLPVLNAWQLFGCSDDVAKARESRKTRHYFGLKLLPKSLHDHCSLAVLLLIIQLMTELVRNRNSIQMKMSLKINALRNRHVWLRTILIFKENLEKNISPPGDGGNVTAFSLVFKMNKYNPTFSDKNFLAK